MGRDLGLTQNFYFKKNKNLGQKIRNPRLNSSENFFSENTMILGRKIRNSRPNSKKDLFLENITILGRKIRNSRLNSRENFFFRKHLDLRTKTGTCLKTPHNFLSYLQSIACQLQDQPQRS